MDAAASYQLNQEKHPLSPDLSWAAEHVDINRERAALRQRVTELERKALQSDEDYEQLDAIHADVLSQLFTANNTTATLNTDIADLQHQNEALQLLAAEATATAEKHVSARSQELEERNAQLAAAVAEADTRNATLAAANQDLETQTQDLAAQNDQLRQELDTAVVLLDQANQAHVGSLAEAQRDHQREMEQITAECQRLQQELQDLRDQALAAAEQRNQELSSNVEAIAAAARAHAQEVKDLQDQVDAMALKNSPTRPPWDTSTTLPVYEKQAGGRYQRSPDPKKTSGGVGAFVDLGKGRKQPTKSSFFTDFM